MYAVKSNLTNSNRPITVLLLVHIYCIFNMAVKFKNIKVERMNIYWNGVISDSD